jgi:hypothetical protein
MLPREIERALLPTLVVRQHGEAWRRPFEFVFEPGNAAASLVQSVD